MKKVKQSLNNTTQQKDPTPLFTGNRIHDTSISEAEKLSDVAKAFFSLLKSRKKK